MKTKLPLVGLAMIPLGTVCLAQTNPAPPPADDWKPISYVSPGQQYPQLNSERRAKFRIAAPAATEVAVSPGRPLTVAKGEDGAWTVSTSPRTEGFHYYQITVDGACAADQPITRFTQTLMVPAT